MPSEPPLCARLSDDGVPAFRLSWIRHRYRIRLLDAIADGSIRLERVRVCSCGGKSFRKISDKDRFGLPFASYACALCGVVILNPRIHPDSLPRYYESIYHPLVLGTSEGATLDELVRIGQNEAVWSFLEPELITSKHDVWNILEIGCGSGQNLARIRHGLRSLGIESHLYACEYEKSYCALAESKGIAVREGGLEMLKGFGVKFDLVVMSHVFEHLPAPIDALVNVLTFMNDDAWLFIEVPGLRNLEPYDGDLLDYLVHAHLYNFDLAALKGLVLRCGCSLVKGDETVRGLFRRGGSVCTIESGGPEDLWKYIKAVAARGPTRRGGLRRILRPIWETYYRVEKTISRNRGWERFYDERLGH